MIIKSAADNPSYSPDAAAHLMMSRDAAIDFAVRYGGISGDHHKAWVIDQMVRALAMDSYERIMAEAYTGGYSWDVGVAP